MNYLKRLLVFANGINLVIFAIGFIASVMSIILVDNPQGLEPEDYWGALVLGSILLFSALLALFNLSKIFGYFKSKTLFSYYANIGFAGLYFLVGVAGVLESGVTGREMLLGFLFSSVFLFSGCFLRKRGRIEPPPV